MYQLKLSEEILYSLKKNGFCVRVRGGATRNSEFIHSSTLAYRVCQNERFKREIGRKALKFINEGDIIGIDSGSTAAIFAEAVKETFSRLYHQDMILVQQAMCDNTDRVFCLADNSQFEKNALCKLSDISGKVTLISDNSLSNEIKRLYLENNIRIY